MKVVISGGTGFIGLALGARLLRDGAEVHLLILDNQISVI